MKKEIDAAKALSSELKGHLSAIDTQIQQDWGCKNIVEAETKIEDWKEEIDTLDETIAEQISELEERYKIE